MVNSNLLNRLIDFQKNRKEKKQKEILDNIQKSQNFIECKFNENRQLCKYSLLEEEAQLKLRKHRLQGFNTVEYHFLVLLVFLCISTWMVLPFLFKISHSDPLWETVCNVWTYSQWLFIALLILLMLLTFSTYHNRKEFYKKCALYEIKKQKLTELERYSHDSVFNNQKGDPHA